MYSLPLYLFPTVLLLILVRKYRENKWGKCKNQVKLKGKVVLVTGANSGIGFEIAKELASRDAEVVLACRNMAKATGAMERIQSELLNNPKLVPMAVDMASLKSVRDLALKVRDVYSKLDILIDNAGVAFPKDHQLVTKDGIEMHFGVNHLAHFYLTTLLEDLLASAKGRVVVMSSILHEKGKIDLHNLNSVKDKLYSNSKLANIYFAQEFARRTKSKGIKVYAICPGWTYTGLFRYSIKWYHYFVVAPIAFLFMRSAKQGAQTAIYCATEPELENETGLLYRDCKHYKSKLIFYDETANSLWNESERMIKQVIE